MSYGGGRRQSLDLTLLWLWHRPVATAQIQPLAWEPPYAVGVALKKKKRPKKLQKHQEKENEKLEKSRYHQRNHSETAVTGLTK